MPGSVTSAFSEPDDYQASLRPDGSLGLLVTGRGRFRARLTQIALDRVRLAAAEEDLSRIGFVAVPAEQIMIPLGLNGRSAPIWSGIAMRPGMVITFGPGRRMHVRTLGLARWGVLSVPVQELTGYGSAMLGAPFAVPAGAQCWQPPRVTINNLHRLCTAAIRAARTRAEAFLAKEAAHGLEQDLIHAAVSCLSAPACDANTAIQTRRHETAVQFETLLETQLTQDLSLDEISAALGISVRFLHRCCAEHIGMSPALYVRLRRMQLAHRGLQTQNSEAGSVAQVARRYGFRHLGRFADTYRALFGELPSDTLRRAGNRTTAHLTQDWSHPRARNS